MAKQIERTDPHCPKNLIPEDYEYVAQECIKIEGLGDCFYIKEQRRLIKEHMARTGGTYSRHEHGGNCGVCGSVNAVYTILFYHGKTNSYVRMDQECAMLVDGGSVPKFNMLRKAVADAREFQKGKKKAQSLLADVGLTTAWDLIDGGRTSESWKEALVEENFWNTLRIWARVRYSGGRDALKCNPSPALAHLRSPRASQLLRASAEGGRMVFNLPFHPTPPDQKLRSTELPERQAMAPTPAIVASPLSSLATQPNPSSDPTCQLGADQRGLEAVLDGCW